MAIMSNSLHVPPDEISLIFVRHGETESNAVKKFMGQLDSPLSARGRDQAAAVSARLGRTHIDAIYTSDLGRAAATAAQIAAACKLPVVTDARLRERNAGIFQGLSHAEAREQFPAEYAETEDPTPESAIPGGESAVHVRTRFVPFLDEVCQRHAGQTVILVTHGAFIRTVLWHLLQSSYAITRWARVDNTSITIIRKERGRWILQTWNDTGHVQDL